MDAGETTYAVGSVPDVSAVYLARAEAEAAADERGGTYIEWTGHTGRQVVTREHEAYAATPEPEPELGT